MKSRECRFLHAQQRARRRAIRSSAVSVRARRSRTSEVVTRPTFSEVRRHWTHDPYHQGYCTHDTLNNFGAQKTRGRFPNTGRPLVQLPSREVRGGGKTMWSCRGVSTPRRRPCRRPSSTERQPNSPWNRGFRHAFQPTSLRQTAQFSPPWERLS